MNTLLEQSLRLPIPERIKLAAEIWDSIAVVPEQVTLSPEQMAEIERRIEDYQNDPTKLIPWEQVKERVRQIA